MTKNKKYTAEEYATNILTAKSANDFILAGDIINDAKAKGMKLNHLSILTDLSVATLSNLSIIAKRSTQKMKKLVDNNKLNFKALREIVRMPDEYRDEVARLIANGKFSTVFIDEVRQELNKIKKSGINGVEVHKLVGDIKKSKRGTLAHNRYHTLHSREPQESAFMPKYTYKHVKEAMSDLSHKIAYMNTTDLVFWQKSGVITELRVLQKCLVYLENDCKIEGNE